jgi:flagellar biosynthesis/type III secretory pathway protein FliH
MADAERGTPAVVWAPEELPGDPRTPRPMNRPTAVPLPNEAALRAEIEERAYIRGYEAGFAAGESAEADRLRSTMRALQEAHDAVLEGAQHWVGNAEANLCALAIAVAQHILGPELTVSRDALVAIVRQALAEFPLDQVLTVRLNPSDYAAAVSAIEQDAVARRDIVWAADPRIVPGGCLVEGRDRIIDGRVDTALERLYRRLASASA